MTGHRRLSEHVALNGDPGRVMLALLAGGKVRLTQADPYVRVSDELLEQAASGSLGFAAFDPATRALVLSDDFGQSFTYRVGEVSHIVGLHRCWEARWPD